jgi:hypothetical protein
VHPTWTAADRLFGPQPAAEARKRSRVLGPLPGLLAGDPAPDRLGATNLNLDRPLAIDTETTPIQGVLTETTTGIATETSLMTDEMIGGVIMTASVSIVNTPLMECTKALLMDKTAKERKERRPASKQSVERGPKRGLEFAV